MAFHPYPQVIPSVFNRSGFGPPRGLTLASACPWLAHLASRLQHTTNFALLRLAFASARFSNLTLPHTATRWLILQKARRHSINTAPTACRRMVSGTISLPSSGYFSPFPYGTSSLSVTSEYLALEGGPPSFTAGFTCPQLLKISRYADKLILHTGLSPYFAGCSKPFCYQLVFLLHLVYAHTKHCFL